MRAIENLGCEERVNVTFIPFPLDPDLPSEGIEINKLLKAKTGQTNDELLRYREQLLQTAAAAGVRMDFTKRTHYYNTVPGHAILQYAQSQNAHHTAYRVLREAYYENGHNFESDIVVDAVNQALRRAGAKPFEMYDILPFIADSVAAKSKYAALGVKSVPTFLINGLDLEAGSGSVDKFEAILQRYLNE